jgi:hypothetical protein
MPKPVFDIKQYELRGLLPEVYTEEQKNKLNETLARVNGQIDWTAQLLGFNGPNYWGLADRKTDGTYNWKGLPETVNQKRRMQVGSFGVYGKDHPYESWPAPFNREEIAASADASFNLTVRNERVIASPLGQGFGADYMHEPILFAGGCYIFDKEIEVEGREVDIDNFVEYYSFKDIGGTYSRLRILDSAIGGTILVGIKGVAARAVPFELDHWQDISDWNTPTVRRQFLGMWGNKGNQLSMDFAFDSLDLYGSDESYSLKRSTDPVSITPEELLERAGLGSTFWTNIESEPYLFSAGECGQWSAISPYLNGPLRGNPWTPQYIEDEVVILDCRDHCDYDLSITQVLSEEDDYDNGEYESFPNADTIYNNAYYEWAVPHSSITEDNSNYRNQPKPKDTIDEVDYDHFPRPTEGFTDSTEIIVPLKSVLDNGFLGADPPASGRKDEGEYDRNPWRYIERFDIRFIPKTDKGLLMRSTCLEWILDPDLDNGSFENSECTANYIGCDVNNGIYSPIHGTPLLVPNCPEECSDVDQENYSPNTPLVIGPNGVDGESYPDFPPYDAPTSEIHPINNTSRPWATADDGIYDEDNTRFNIVDSTQSGLPCEPGVSYGYDDGEYGMLFIDQPCVYRYQGCEADNGLYSVVYGPPEFISDCSWECPPIDNELYEVPGGAFLGPRTANGGELGWERYLPPGCTYVEGGLYFEWDPEENCDCNVTCCEVDQGEVGDDRFDVSNRVDGDIYSFDDPLPELSPIPPIPCAENQPSLKICPNNNIAVSLEKVIGTIPYVSVPNLKNALVPLRTWKDRPLVIKDEVDTANLEYWNYLVADDNKGLDVPGSQRHFVRLPLNYEREGREWNKAYAVCKNQSYFSSPPEIQEMDSTPPQPRPLIYSEIYRTPIDESSVVYEEDYLVSSIGQDTQEIQPGFEDGGLAYENSEYIAFNFSVVTSYDPFEVRVPYADGEWRGSYYSMGLQKGLSGFLLRDLKDNKLLVETSPTYDESIIKRPNIQFPGEDKEALPQNFVVAYAYFAADFSASNDPVFDPDKSQCWRKREIVTAKADPDIVLPPGSLDGNCVEELITTNTAYLLHPAT